MPAELRAILERHDGIAVVGSENEGIPEPIADEARLLDARGRIGARQLVAEKAENLALPAGLLPFFARDETRAAYDCVMVEPAAQQGLVLRVEGRDFVPELHAKRRPHLWRSARVDSTKRAKRLALIEPETLRTPPGVEAEIEPGPEPEPEREPESTATDSDASAPDDGEEAPSRAPRPHATGDGPNVILVGVAAVFVVLVLPAFLSR